MQSRTQFVLEVWESSGAEVVGAAELATIEEALVNSYGVEAPMSPATIARVLADEGVRLGHPEVIWEDARWREERLLFTAEELEFVSMPAATVLIEKIERLRGKFENNPSRFEHLRQSVRQIKSELESIARTDKGDQKRRELAREVAQWLTIWLQNPPIFKEWLALRRTTPDFRSRFHS